MSKMGFFNRPRKEKKEGIQRLEELLQHEPEVPPEVKRKQMIGLAKEAIGGLVGTVLTVSVIAGSFGTCMHFFGRKVEEPKADMALVSPEQGEDSYARYASQIGQIAREEDVPEHIFEGMVLACSSQNPYSLHQRQGLGGAVLLDPIEAGATKDALDQDPSLSLRIAARKYKSIRKTAADDEEALAIFFSSTEAVANAKGEAGACSNEEGRRNMYLGDESIQGMLETRRSFALMDLERRGISGEEREKEEAKIEAETRYPDQGLDFMRNHGNNARCMYYVNNLDDFAREAVKLALTRHPNYARYWRAR